MTPINWLPIFILLAGPAQAEQEALRPHTLTNTKVYETEHLRFVFSRGLQDHVAPLARETEKFINDLERKWAVRLPKRKIQVNMNVGWPLGATWSHLNGPPWLFGHFDPAHSRIELRTRRMDDFQLKPISRELNHHVIHYVLNIKSSTKLPYFFEEGLAAHYAGFSENQDRLSAVVGFAKAGNLQPWLEARKTFENRNDFHYAAAIGRRFVAWLWKSKPKAEHDFLQAYLGGASHNAALAGAGLTKINLLLSDFETQVRPNYKLYHALLTFDFWVILVGLMVLFYFALQVALAYRTSKMTWREIDSSASDPVPEDLFIGPVFSPLDEEREADLNLLPIAPAETRVSANPTPLQDNPFEGIEADLDQVFDRLDTSFETPADLGYGGSAEHPSDAVDQVFQDLDASEQSMDSAQKQPGDPANARRQLPSQTPKGKVGDEQEVDDHLDGLFGDWDS